MVKGQAVYANEQWVIFIHGENKERSHRVMGHGPIGAGTPLAADAPRRHTGGQVSVR